MYNINSSHYILYYNIVGTVITNKYPVSKTQSFLENDNKTPCMETNNNNEHIITKDPSRCGRCGQIQTIYRQQYRPLRVGGGSRLTFPRIRNTHYQLYIYYTANNNIIMCIVLYLYCCAVTGSCHRHLRKYCSGSGHRLSAIGVEALICACLVCRCSKY